MHKVIEGSRDHVLCECKQKRRPCCHHVELLRCVLHLPGLYKYNRYRTFSSELFKVHWYFNITILNTDSEEFHVKWANTENLPFWEIKIQKSYLSTGFVQHDVCVLILHCHTDVNRIWMELCTNILKTCPLPKEGATRKAVDSLRTNIELFCSVGGQFF